LSIGTRLLQLRNQKGLSQRQLSQRCGLASSYLSRIENRRLEPRPKTLRRIAAALGVPISELFEERPGGEKQTCAITASGRCIMELLRSGRGRASRARAEGYTPRQLQLLRMANYVIQSGDGRLLSALDVLLSGLLAAVEGRAEKATPPVGQ
jgi:transcriptional regulator with XRE-family HTH domain